MVSRDVPSPLDAMYGSITPNSDIIDARVTEAMVSSRKLIRDSVKLELRSHEHPLFRNAIDTWVDAELVASEEEFPTPAHVLKVRADTIKSLIEELKADDESPELIEIAKAELAVCKSAQDKLTLGRLSVVDTVHVKDAADSGTGFYL